MKAQTRPRNGTSCFSDAPMTSVPSSTMLPVAFSPAGSSPMMANAVSDFPEPDSPISPMRSPGATVKETSRTRAIAVR